MRAGNNQYAPMPGVLALREAIAVKVQQCYGARVDPQTEVQIVCGATAGLYATLTAFVQPGDEVILFEPCYDSYVPGHSPEWRHAGVREPALSGLPRRLG